MPETKTITITPIDLIEKLRLGYHLGTALQLVINVSLGESKNPVSDLQSASWLILRHIESSGMGIPKVQAESLTTE